MNCLSNTFSLLRQYAWKLAVCLLTAAFELWVVIATLLLGESANLQVTLIQINCLNGFALICLFGHATKIVYDKVGAAEDLTRYLALGADFWPPFPRWEWNAPPCQFNVVDWNYYTGWAGIYPKTKPEVSLVKVQDGAENNAFKYYTKGRIDMKQVDFLDPGSVEPAHLTEYEIEYLTSTQEQKLPSAVVCVCYLLQKGSNQFLMESIEYFTKVHDAPLHVVINAKESGESWIYNQLLQVSAFLQKNNLRQVRCFFVNDSRSKACNLNAFIDALPPVDSELQYKYVMNYDVDDRPAFNERSMLEYAEGIVGKMRAGHKIFGIQGPCIECFNDTFSGLLESSLEYGAQAASGLLSWEARFLGKVKSQGSNHLVLTSVFRRHRFRTDVLLEDWRWTCDIMEKENMSLAYVRSMVCFGQTPYGWAALSKRRNRWNKGRFQESIHDAFARSAFGPAFKDWAYAWSGLVAFVVIQPLLHFFMLIGYGVIFNESYRQGYYGLLGMEELEESSVDGTLGYLWNYSWLGSLTAICAIHLLYFVQTVRNLESSSFMNGRQGFMDKCGHTILHFLDMFSFLIKPLTRSYQYEYYCAMEFFLEKLLCQKTKWVATAKIAEKPSADFSVNDETEEIIFGDSSDGSFLEDKNEMEMTDSSTHSEYSV